MTRIVLSEEPVCIYPPPDDDVKKFFLSPISTNENHETPHDLIQNRKPTRTTYQNPAQPGQSRSDFFLFVKKNVEEPVGINPDVKGIFSSPISTNENHETPPFFLHTLNRSLFQSLFVLRYNHQPSINVTSGKNKKKLHAFSILCSVECSHHLLGM